MTEKANRSREGTKLLHRTFRGSFIVIGLLIAAGGIMSGGILSYIGGILGVGLMYLAVANRLNPLIIAISRRQSETIMQVTTTLLPILITGVSLMIPFFIWLGWQAGIPLKTHQTMGVGIFLIAAAAGLILFITNITSMLRNR